MRLDFLNDTSKLKENRTNRMDEKDTIRREKLAQAQEAKDDNFQQLKKRDEYSKSDFSNDRYSAYDRTGLYASRNLRTAPAGLSFDKGTASQTTVYVNRAAYDQILSATTFGETKWEEMGVDNDKRWVVINGQRFECEHSPEEKAMRKRAQMTLVDYMAEEDKKKKEDDKGKYNGADKPRGNIDALLENKEVMKLLGGIFKADTPEMILSRLS